MTHVPYFTGGSAVEIVDDVPWVQHIDVIKKKVSQCLCYFKSDWTGH